MLENQEVCSGLLVFFKIFRKKIFKKNKNPYSVRVIFLLPFSIMYEIDPSKTEKPSSDIQMGFCSLLDDMTSRDICQLNRRAVLEVLELEEIRDRVREDRLTSE